MLEQAENCSLQPKCYTIRSPSQRGRWASYTLLGFHSKTVQFQGKLFTATFLQAAVAGPILGIDFFRKLKVTASPEINQIQFACSAVASPTLYLPSLAPPTHPLLSAASSASPFLSSSTPVPAPVQFHSPLQRLLHSLLSFHQS
jgi:hypothetical protein